MGRPATDKRDKLVAAAIEQFHHHGYARTSLAEIARAAGLSTGHLFYYFRAKEDLAGAVVEAWCRLLSGYLVLLEARPTPRARLEGFLDQACALSGLYVAWGCPLAGLARDLRQEDGPLKTAAARPYGVQRDWLVARFREAGWDPAPATEHAAALMARYHGAILLAHVQGDAGVIDREVAALKGWMAALAPPPQAAR